MRRTKTRTATIHVDENGILHITMHEGAHVDYEDALDNYLVIRNLTDNQPALKLVDSRESWTMDKKATEFIHSKEIREKTIARALLKSSFISCMLASFFSALRSDKVPTRVFHKYEAAYDWLLSFRKDQEPGS